MDLLRTILGATLFGMGYYVVLLWNNMPICGR